MPGKTANKMIPLNPRGSGEPAPKGNAFGLRKGAGTPAIPARTAPGQVKKAPVRSAIVPVSTGTGRTGGIAPPKLPTAGGGRVAKSALPAPSKGNSEAAKKAAAIRANTKKPVVFPTIPGGY